ncbi:MAG: hypothetical protein HFACDABA_02476 [Anaerolineales bacterium]|nr:hypothetical protein [Anaerolineales bacterium]
MKLSKYVIALLVLVIPIFVISCSKSRGGHQSTFSNGIGYQYDLPSDFCRNLMLSNGMELYCTEGRIIIEILPGETGKELSEKLALEIWDELGIPSSLYNVVIKKSAGNMDGVYRDIVLATKSDFSTSEINDSREDPYYVALSMFGSDKIFVARGYLYNIQFENKFTDIFSTVIQSFEPFAPP